MGADLSRADHRRILLVVMAEQRVLLEGLYSAMQAAAPGTHVAALGAKEQKQLPSTLRRLRAEDYDRVVIFLRLKKLTPHWRFLSKMENLVVLEHDACQNFMPYGKYQGKYTSLYQRLPNAKVIVSGYRVAERFREQGIPAVCVPKGFDQNMVHNTRRSRDIEFGFIGSLGTEVYRGRRCMLEQLEKQGVVLLKTASGAEYVETLNRIRVFVSADVDMGEYMIKNFEAMAAGCVLMAWHQGGEEERLGLVHGENVFLYDSVESAIEVMRLIRDNWSFSQQVASAGQAWVSTTYTFSEMAQRLLEEVEAPLPKRKAKWGRLRRFLHNEN